MVLGARRRARGSCTCVPRHFDIRHCYQPTDRLRRAVCFCVGGRRSSGRDHWRDYRILACEVRLPGGRKTMKDAFPMPDAPPTTAPRRPGEAGAPTIGTPAREAELPPGSDQGFWNCYHWCVLINDCWGRADPRETADCLKDCWAFCQEYHPEGAPLPGQ